VTSHIDALVAQAKLAANRVETSQSTPGSERQRLERLATEFESMLLVQVLKDMRRAGRWSDDVEGGGDVAGAESLFEMLDAELATQLTRAQGFGIAKQMLAAFDRAQGASAPMTAASPPDERNGILETDEGGDHSHEFAAMGDDLGSRLRAAHVTSSFGWRRDPITGEAKFHKGVDLRAAYGQDVPAMQPGTVMFSGNQGNYGTTVVIEHPNGSRSRYAHLSVALVNSGDAVSAGQSIGRAGSSGRATGPHLHFELLDGDGVPQDPMR
jgi:murein DD-endopeptidase MepM/ murein hydrolase activator NlpD